MTTETAMRTIDTLLAQYGDSHRNPVNEWMHIVCVPLIVFSVLGLLWSVHAAVALAGSVAALAYYVKLSRPFALGMLAMLALMLIALAAMQPIVILPLSLVLFVLAWIGQFIGHQIEGRKPSFLDDVRFLLIGPLFVLGFAYRSLRLAY